MNVLLTGSGGREHALAWKLTLSPGLGKLYVAPGNGGHGEPGPKRAHRRRRRPGPGGLRPAERRGPGGGRAPSPPWWRACPTPWPPGASPVSARTPSPPGWRAPRSSPSRSWTKPACPRPPTASSRTSRPPGRTSLRGRPPWWSRPTAWPPARAWWWPRPATRPWPPPGTCWWPRPSARPGRPVIVEDCLVGEEASFLALCDGERIAVMPSCQDHKAVNDGDTGPNTGGHGGLLPRPGAAPRRAGPRWPSWSSGPSCAPWGPRATPSGACSTPGS